MSSYKRTPLKKVMMYVFLIALLFIYLFPLLWMLSTSLKEASEVFAGANLIPKKLSFESYIIAWSRFNLKQYLFNTILVAAAVTLGTIIACSLAGYAYGQLRFPGKNLLFFLYLGTMMVPVAVTLIPAYYIILKLSWVNTYQALIVPFVFGNAFGTFLLRQFYMTLPKELSESAKIDGAGYFQTWWSIMLPIGKPALATLAVMTLVAQWNSFIWPLVVVQSPSLKVLSVGLSDFRLNFAIQWNTLMAAVMVAILPMILILLFAQKLFIKGIQFTGINR
ncbi:MAG: carbohydrate ABC transporter permease [Firmicutes bacterium]|nr:carbohydrate ABC transporter permease [Bacillota bacterium]